LPQISPFSIETELLLIYPAELRFACWQKDEYMSLTNKTNDEVVYAINDDGWEDYPTAYDSRKRNRVVTVGVVPPRSTCAVLVPYCLHQPYLGVMMVSGSRNYRTGSSLHFKYDTRDELMNQVRAEGGNVHEAVLPCAIRDSQPVEDEVLAHLIIDLISL
jgi:hypothetical protein